MRYIMLSVLAVFLSGCGFSGMSDKSTNVQSGVEETKQDCHPWCHNGWCSNHCDPLITN